MVSNRCLASVALKEKIKHQINCACEGWLVAFFSSQTKKAFCVWQTMEAFMCICKHGGYLQKMCQDSFMVLPGCSRFRGQRSLVAEYRAASRWRLRGVVAEQCLPEYLWTFEWMVMLHGEKWPPWKCCLVIPTYFCLPCGICRRITFVNSLNEPILFSANFDRLLICLASRATFWSPQYATLNI